MRIYFARQGTRVWSRIKELRPHVPQPEGPWAATKDSTCHGQDLIQLNNKQTRIIISKVLNNNKQNKNLALGSGRNMAGER